MKPQTIIVNAILAATILLSLTLTSCAGEIMQTVPVEANMSRLVEYENILYAFNETNNTVVVAGFNRENIEPKSQVRIPEAIKTSEGYYIVSGIADFGCCEMPMQTIILPKTLSKIGRFAFYDCTNLRFIKLQGSECPEASNVAFEENTFKEAFLHIPDTMEELTPTFSLFRQRVIYKGQLCYTE